MRSLNHSMVSLENGLTRSIRGYDGYQVPQTRSKTDRHLREFLSEKLKQIEKDFSRFGHVIRQYKNNTYFETFDRVALSLKMLIQSLEKPSYNQSNFLDQKTISPYLLSQLYEHEVQLVNQIEILGDEIQYLDNIGGEHEVADMLNHLFDLIDGVNQTLSEREFIILGDVQ